MAEHILTAIKSTLAALASSLWVQVEQVLNHVASNDTRYVVYICAGVVGLLLLARIVRISFTILQKIVLPAALVSWAIGNYCNLPFFTLFPALVGVGSAWMLFKT